MRADAEGSTDSSKWQAPSTGSSELLNDSDDSSEWEDHGDIAGDERDDSDVALSTGHDSAPGPSSAFYVQGSTDVHVGTKTIFQEPVTIHQHVHVARNEHFNPSDLQKEALKSPGVVIPEVHTNGFVHYDCKSTTAAALPDKEKKALCCTQPLFWGLLGAAALLSVAAVITVYSIPADSKDTLRAPNGVPKNLPEIPPIDDYDNPNKSLPNKHRIFSKDEWGGYAAKATQRLVHPTKYVVISHTAGLTCFDSKTCSYYVRNIQDLHQANPNMNDIGYNFLIGGDGNVYEGRGWDVTNFHTGFVNKNNIGICFLGNFVKDSPTYSQMESAQQLIALGVKLGKLDTNYKIVAHNQTDNTLSPGPNIYSVISKWPHFYVPSAEDPAT